MVNIGIIGCGSITRFRHAPEYSSNMDAKIVGFFDPVKERAQEMSERYGGKVYETYKELLSDSSIDAVSVCSSNSTHAQITIDALQAGKHVLCEKPMATSIEDAIKMNEAAKKAGKYLMIGHNQRLDDAHKRAKEILLSGTLGEIISFETTFSHGGPEAWGVDKSLKTWFFNKKDAFVGAMGDLGIHKTDLIRWLISDEIEEVTAILATLNKRDYTGKFIEVDDNAFCILRSKTGIVGTLNVSWSNYGLMDNSTIINCSNGVMKIHSNPDFPLEIVMKNGDRTYYKINSKQTNEGQTNSGIIDMFVGSIVNNIPPEISGDEGLAALRIVFACMESSVTGKAVNVNDTQKSC